MSEPTTAAGRALLGGLRYYQLRVGNADHAIVPEQVSQSILAIEAEARAAALDEARAAADAALWDLEGPNASHPGIRVEYRRRVMAAIDALRRTKG